MTRSRGRPVRPMPVHPERVISRAMKAGLSVTIRLQRDISNKNTKKYYERSRERFRIRQQVYQIAKARGNPDFSHISKSEGPIRDDIRLMFYESAAKYGFTEVSRQKNADDTVDPLNQRFNVCGAVVRENSEIMFPFPDPEDFGIYSRRDGEKRKKFRRAGYTSSSFGPKVILAHPDLPSLDFGDAVRSHSEYLATFCAIHGISVRETTRYSQLFFLLVRPYLEYLYSEFTCGKSNFQKGVNWALRRIKDLIIETGYRPTIYEKKTVTRQLESEFDETIRKHENWTFFKRIEKDAGEVYGNHPIVFGLKLLRGELGEGKIRPRKEVDSTFTVDDVEHIRKKVAKKTRIAGSIIHRRIADLFPSPWHLNDIIFSGDRYTRSSDYIILSEVPIETESGKGKVDLLLCERTVSENGKRAFWKPVMVFEIKTRLGQSLYIDADYKESEVRSEDSQRVVSEFLLSNHPFNDNRWDEIVQSTPTPSARKQLEIYCQALKKHYVSVTEQESNPLLRGVVVIESSSDISAIRSIIERIIIHGYEKVKHRVRTIKRTVFTPSDSDYSRITLVIDKQPGPKRVDDESIKVPWSPMYSPFKINEKLERTFLLYLTGYSPTSAGQSAAWNARYYHGFQMLYEMSKKQKNIEFIWIDLASQFNEPRLAEARLRLRPRSYSEEETAKTHPNHIREFFENIKVKGYLDDIVSFLYNDDDLPSFDVRTRKSKRVIVISGADTLRDATPLSHREKFSVLVERLVNSLPDEANTTILWFDSPVPSVEKSIPYSTRTLLPFYDNSPLGPVVTEILWNLPIAPKGFVQPEKWSLPTIAEAPMHDDIRVIVRHSTNEFHTELIHVPFLTGWSKRFRNKGAGQVMQEQDVEDMVPEKKIRNRMKLISLTLLPWLVRLWPAEKLIEGPEETIEDQMVQLREEYHGGSEPLDFTPTTLSTPLCKSPSLLDLVVFRLPATMDALSYQAMTLNKINSQRLYRSPRSLQTTPQQKVSEDATLSRVHLSKIEEEQEWVFGVKFQSDDEDIQSWWLVTQDPESPSRILVGCFTERPSDKDGFLWAENRLEILTQSSLDEILGFPQVLMIGNKTLEGMVVWNSLNGEAPVFAGTLEVKGQGRSPIGHIRALRQILAEEPVDGPSFDTQPPEAFYTRVVDALRRHLATVASPTPVSLQLEMVDESCNMKLSDENDTEVQHITIDYTADLISLLRWPIIRGGPMFTDSGKYVTWSIYDDIDYGELYFIRPYVIYTSARKTPEELPKRIIQFFDEAEDLTVSISHDATVCPIAQSEGIDHDCCWRIELPPDCPDSVRQQLDQPLTGEEVNGILAPGKFFAGRLYTFVVSLPQVSEKDESIVFHEERYIRIFFRSKEIPLKKLTPGTFLTVAEQEWRVSIEWEVTHFKWTAQSTLSGLSFRGKQQFIELIHGHNAEDECERLLGIITSQIPAKQILEYIRLKEQVLAKLESKGYSKKSPRCELRFISQSESFCEFGVFLTNELQRNPLTSHSIEVGGPMDHDGIIERISEGLNEGELSTYNVVNVESFLAKLADWLQEHVPILNEDSEEQEEHEVMLSANVKTGEIYWIAKAGGRQTSGTIYTDPKMLRRFGQKAACDEVQKIFEIEVLKEIYIVANLDEVQNEQIPDLVRRIIDGEA